MTSQELIRGEVEKLINNTRNSLQDVKKIAVAEAWRLLQIATASIIQIIEAIGNDLAGSEKKALALELLNSYYDRVFSIVDVPFVPNIIEPMMHKYVKGFLMILLGATIDSMVTIFRNTGVFLKKQTQSEV